MFVSSLTTEQEILDKLDHSNDGNDGFVMLGEPYSYLIDVRLNVFCDERERWAIAVERLGYNPRAGAISLDIHYYGNCLLNLEHYNGRSTNSYSIYPVLANSFEESVNGEEIKEGAAFWLVRGSKVSLTYTSRAFSEAGIELSETESGSVRIEEMARLVIVSHRALFRATDPELRKSLPSGMKKILVVDEWHHRDFNYTPNEPMSERQMLLTYQTHTGAGGTKLSFEQFAGMIRQQEKATNERNRQNWNENRPGAYETWQLIAKVIVSGNPALYQPRLKPNTHWKNWPDSGSL
ncbi:hypothetical protein [Pedobacter sp. SYP-B3415]|uniref:DUF7003 family protein n=1 Tax=Pedobacter sp. SYP-B3415 TaxID=2496641 RepID=UPI00101DFEA9|nr:hypothetical protein [Pedobacter sp. SYP-B3415]